VNSLGTFYRGQFLLHLHILLYPKYKKLYSQLHHLEYNIFFFISDREILDTIFFYILDWEM